MADEKREVRVEERLKIKIGEAKNLPMRSHGSVTERDVYCTLSLDQEEIFRTSTIDRTLDPFFGEEFQFSVPRKFRYLSIYVYDRDKTEKVIGKVAIKREELQAYHNKDHWFQIKPVNQHTEVQGKVHLEAKFDNGLESTSERLTVRVSECSDLTLCNGSCDPFASVAVRYTSGRVETQRTKIKKKTNSPIFDESFTFQLGNCGKGNESRYCVSAQEGNWCELVVTLFHDGGGNNIFLGEVRVPLQQNMQQSAWYLLQPGKRNGKSKGTPVSTDIGSLRLKIHYTRDYVFKSCMYDTLRGIILKSATMQPITSSACYLLGEIIHNKIDAAQPLARLFLHHGMIVPVIKALATWEISRTTDPNTIFRGNTLVSKMMDETMKLAGLHYLHETLRPLINTVISERKSCEIDPTRISDSGRISDLALIRTNFNNLKVYVESIFQAVTSSALRCPPILCELFHELREIAVSRFPDNKEVRYSVISGFIFLRFFAPAILGPRLFDLTNKHIDTQINRTLTLISKTIQSLCNLVTSRTTSCKEQYMGSMHQAFYNEKHITAVRQFLEIISASSRSPPHDSKETPVVLKEGLMTKRAQGRKRFGRKNFKQRYFTLTTHDLTYSKQKGKEPLCTIPLSDILAVERVHDDSFRKSNMFQIVQPHRVLYVQANNCVEEKEWVDMLAKMCYTNDHRLHTYHPSAFVNGHWPCCHLTSASADGCCNVSSQLQLHMNIDSERELARIHSLIIQHMDRLQSFMSYCEQRTHHRNDSVVSCVIEDNKSGLQTLYVLKEAAFELQAETRIYLRMVARETKYGSKQAPIGDDNYLLLASRLDAGTLRKC